MGTYNFLLANDSDLSEIMNLYHSIIGTPGCTWRGKSKDYNFSRMVVENGGLITKNQNKAF